MAVNAGAGEPDDLLCMMLVDTVTGRILHTHCQESGSGPVSAVFFDNVGVVMFTEKVSLKRVALALEVYDHSYPFSDVWNSLGMHLFAVECLMVS